MWEEAFCHALVHCWAVSQWAAAAYIVLASVSIGQDLEPSTLTLVPLFQCLSCGCIYTIIMTVIVSFCTVDIDITSLSLFS